MPGLSNQSGANGYTHHWIINWDDAFLVAGTTDSVAGAVTDTYALPAGSHIRHATAYLETAFNDSGGGDELNFDLGVTGGDADGIFAAAATPIHADQTEITYLVGAGADMISTNTGPILTAAGSLTINVYGDITTGTAYSTSELTAGKLHLFLDVATPPSV
jgi:hypothetical protein